MKATDLMLGDWVTFADALKAGDFYPIMITSLTLPDRIAGYHPHPAIEGSDVYGEEDLVGIPLTPEILEKNGWKHKYYGIYRQTIGETITIDIFPEGCSVEDERGSQCFYRLRYHLPALKFVHELQHALRLCGIEKEIEL